MESLNVYFHLSYLFEENKLEQSNKFSSLNIKLEVHKTLTNFHKLNQEFLISQ